MASRTRTGGGSLTRSCGAPESSLGCAWSGRAEVVPCSGQERKLSAKQSGFALAVELSENARTRLRDVAALLVREVRSMIVVLVADEQAVGFNEA
jgi:hypothetical protein